MTKRDEASLSRSSPTAYGDYPDLSQVKRVLVVKLRHLGDVLLTTPLFSVLKKFLPSAEIDAYIYRAGSALLENHPAISKIHAYDRAWKKERFPRRLLREAKLLKQIRDCSYDLVINLTEGDRGALAARFSGAKIRVGIDKRKIYTHVAKNCPSLRHTVERQLDVLRRIGIFPSQEERELFLAIPDSARESVRRRLPWSRFILIHPTSRWRFKCISVQMMRLVAQRLIEQGEKLVFTSGNDSAECSMIKDIVQGLPSESFCSLAGAITIQELGALIESCAVLLCVDSLPFHMASALKAPVVALFGPTSEVTWGPWRNPQARVLTEKISCRPCYLDGCGGGKVSDCLQSISLERILLELEVAAKIGTSCLRIID